MTLWQEIKHRIFPSEKKNYLEPYDSGSLWDNHYLNFLKKNNVRISAATPAAAYSSHELVFACVNKIADVMNDAEIVVERLNSDGEYESEPGHPLNALFSRPNSNDIGEDFRRKMVISEQAAGIVYIAVNRSRAGLPAELAILNPYRVTPRSNSDRTEILYYEYKLTNGRIRRIKPEDIFIRRRADLFNQNLGLAPMAVALNAINSDLGLTTYIDAFFESDGTPSGILKILNRTVSQTDKEKLQSDWKQKYGRGGANQKGLAVLDQNAEYQKIGSNLDELDSEAVSDRFESRICSVFGVPPILVGANVGLKHTTANATMKSALNDFWTNKISPELKPLRKWLTWVMLPEFESIEDIKSGKVRVAWDISQAGFLQEEVNDIYNRSIKAYMSDILTKNEARAAMGLNPADDGDIFRSEIVRANIESANQITAGNDINDINDQSSDAEKALEPVKKKNLQSDYWREPTELEKLIDLKKKIDDLESASDKLSKLFLSIRTNLISAAAGQVADLGFENLEQLDLSVSNKQTKQTAKLLKEIFAVGQQQIINELQAQESEKSKSYETKDREFDIFTLVNLVLVKIVSEIRNRAVNIAVLLYSAEQFKEEFKDELKEEVSERLLKESLKIFEQLARNSANLTIQAGRETELDNQDIKRFEYSAILDKATCSQCRKWDGEQSENINDLPKCPNKKCAGEWNCRCFIIGIAD